MHIGAAVADALDAAHRAGIVHRDMKPGNVLLSNEGRVLLSDFGIAKALSAASDLTSDNVMLGTAKYLSPEQVTGARRSIARSDLYSLAVVLYESLTGRVPFVADTDAATALMRLRREPMPVRSIRPGVPRPLDDLVLTTLARESERRRPANATVFRDALLRVNAGSSDDATSVAGPAPRSSDVIARGFAVDVGHSRASAAGQHALVGHRSPAAQRAAVAGAGSVHRPHCPRPRRCRGADRQHRHRLTLHQGRAGGGHRRGQRRRRGVATGEEVPVEEADSGGPGDAQGDRCLRPASGRPRREQRCGRQRLRPRPGHRVDDRAVQRRRHGHRQRGQAGRRDHASSSTSCRTAISSP